MGRQGRDVDGEAGMMLADGEAGMRVAVFSACLCSA